VWRLRWSIIVSISAFGIMEWVRYSGETEGGIDSWYEGEVRLVDGEFTLKSKPAARVSTFGL
jgi:hypothetical protein